MLQYSFKGPSLGADEAPTAPVQKSAGAGFWWGIAGITLTVVGVFVAMEVASAVGKTAKRRRRRA